MESEGVLVNRASGGVHISDWDPMSDLMRQGERGAEVETRLKGNIQIIKGLKIFRSVLALKQPLLIERTLGSPLCLHVLGM